MESSMKVCTAISHILFTDDNMIFTKATQEECCQIQEIIDIYADASRNRRTFKKPEVFVNLGTLD